MAGFGETLNQARTHMGVTLKEAEQATRINRHHLSALEEERFSALPPLIYQRGIVRSYASYLKLDPSRLLVMFEEAQGGGAGKLPTGGVVSNPPISMPSHWTPNFAIIAFTLVLSAIVFAWVYSAFVAPPDTSTAPTQTAPTATPFESDLAVPTNPPTQIPPSPTATVEAAATQSADGSTRASDSTDQPANRRGGDSVRSENSTNTGTSPEATTEPQDIETPVVTPTQVIDDATMTSISISATSTIWVTVWADDQVVFDGNLGAGESTGHMAGANFRVYTSQGDATEFTNACGDVYYMGYEQGQANYTLSRTDGSCAPIRD